MDREDNNEKETTHSLRFIMATLLAVIMRACSFSFTLLTPLSECLLHRSFYVLFFTRLLAKGEMVMEKGKVTIRIQRKVSKRRYLDGKRTYTYERFYVPIPKQFHDKIEPFLNKNLKVQVKPVNGGLKIICTPPRKRFCPPKTPP